MDVAYDHIQEESLSAEVSAAREEQPPITLETEFQNAIQAVSASPWGARLGGFFGQVKKQSESLYSDAQKEYNERSQQASRGLTGLINHTRNISIQAPTSDTAVSFSDPTFTLPEQDIKAKQEKAKAKEESEKVEVDAEQVQRPESLPADIVKEAASIVNRFRAEAPKEATSLVTRLRSEAPTLLTRIQKAEDAADEALLKFGSGIRNFLREAVTVTGPEGGAAVNKDGEASELLFETNDAEGKRVFHSSRFDAQLHVIHTTPSSFTKDPESDEYAAFKENEFDVDKQTEAIAKDLDKYVELRRAMEKLVPEKVDYVTFWGRYYFLRKVIEEEERRRKEVLKGATVENEEELGWGSDDSENEDESTTPNAARSSSTLAATPKAAPPKIDLLKPVAEPRKSEEDGKSTAGSDASYDIVSGATSRAPGSPKEEKKDVAAEAVKEEESDEEDWE